MSERWTSPVTLTIDDATRALAGKLTEDAGETFSALVRRLIRAEAKRISSARLRALLAQKEASE